MNIFLPCYFITGLILAPLYGTWFIAIAVGSLLLVAYYSAKLLLPRSPLYQYVLSTVLGIFMAQYIYQLHGLFEMHFFAFIGSAVLITYQKWSLQIPMFILVVLHHTAFSYLQNTGTPGVYFTQLDQFGLQTLVIHFVLTAVIFFICGLWAFQLKKFSAVFVLKTIEVEQLQKEAEQANALAILNHELQQQAKELAFINAELEQFAYAASHDMQEPLRTITSFVTLINNKYGDVFDDKGRQYISLVIDGAQRMRYIITDLLEFSRAGRNGGQLEDVDLEQTVAEFSQLYHQQITQQKATINFTGLPVISGLKVPLKQIFQNLLSNALKYSIPGKAPVIDIKWCQNNSHWQFSISDNGIGMQAADLEKIFVIFKRLHGSSEYPGTGIGLAITKKLVEYMGGLIWVESEEGRGSTFHFTIAKYSGKGQIYMATEQFISG
ncbi:sensor histidine kinase [Mucilaginibacter pedocola]|nr:ATP-binding protein [Mucilaginibacter pedocola]